MKKFLLFVAVALVCSTVSAQLVTSSTYKKQKSKAVWYVKAGLDIAGVSGDGWDCSWQLKALRKAKAALKFH